MKRFILFLFALGAIISANAMRVTIDDLNYSLIAESHEAIISYGNKCSGELVIPSEVSNNGQTYAVKRMLWKAFYDCTELTKVRIPKSLDTIMHYYPNDPDGGDVEAVLVSSDVMNPFRGCTSLEAVEVDSDNPDMKSAEGVLFNKVGTRLYCYPAGIKAKSYKVPQGVEWIGIYAFADADITKIDLPESIQTICTNAFWNCKLDIMIIRGHLDEHSVSGSLLRCLKETSKLYVPASEVDRYKSIFAGEVLPLEKYTEPVAFTEGQMATIVLPTEPEASRGKYYRLDRVEGNEIIFEQELQPRAHIPYIIVPGEDFCIEHGTLDLNGLSRDTVSIDGVSFIGTYQKEEIRSKKGFYFEIIDATPDCILSDNKLKVGALRAFLQVHWDDPYSHGGTKAPAEKLQIVLHDHGTGLKTLSNSPLKGEDIYDLNGRIVNGKLSNSKLPQGIYIKDGRKRLKK